jgi:hypothetical protein
MAVTFQRKRSMRGGRALLFGYFRREVGNTAAIMALLLVPLVGALSVGVETSNWFLIGRAAQNAADSAAVAAATNNSSIVVHGAQAEYLDEGQATAASYGFTNGSNNVTVSVASGQTCPDGTSTCYKATVSKVVPIYLTAIAGFRGDTTIGSVRAKTITNIAYAEAMNVGYPSCLTAVGSDTTVQGNSTAISGNGTPTASAPNCSIAAVGASPSTISCTGSNGLGAPYGFASAFSPSGNHQCTGTEAKPSASYTFCNPYAASGNSSCSAGTATAVSNAVTSASSTPCSVTTVAGHGNGNNATTYQMSAITASCTWSSGGNTLSLTGDLAPTSPMVVVVSGGGYLDMGTHSSSNITWIFTNSSGGPGTFASGSNINITAPDVPSNPLTPTVPGNPLNGIAAYQVASACTSSSLCDSWSLSGNNTVQVTGLLYLPYTNGSFQGAVGETSTGNCFVSVFNTFSDGGTGLLLDEKGCANAGLTSLPQVQRSYVALVK